MSLCLRAPRQDLRDFLQRASAIGISSVLPSRAPAQLEKTLFQSFGADGDAQRNADQIGVFEFHSRALVTVIEQNFDAACLQLLIEFIGSFANLLSL